MTPVILTASATILGLIPLAIGLNMDFVTLFRDFNPHLYFGGDSTAFWGPLSWTMIFGLGFATFLTLIMVPVMYLLTEHLREAFRQKNMFKNIFSVKGRIRRTEYAFSMIICVVILMIVNWMGSGSSSPASSIALLAAIIPIVVFMVIQRIKRCHDLNQSGWFQLIPFYGLWLLFAEGTAGSNRFGDDPKMRMIPATI